MRKLVPALITAGALALGAAIEPVAAINSYNAQPAPERTEVGLFLVLWDRDGDGVIDRFSGFCSGTMIDDDTYLTAGHCTGSAADWPAGTRWFVSLEEDVQTLLVQAREGRSPEEAAQLFLDEGWAVEGDIHQDPAGPGTAADSHDIGVVDFAERAVTPADVWTFTPARLPTADQLTRLGSRALDAADWIVVGYGTQEAVRGPGGHTHPGGGVRLKAPLDFNALNPAWVRLAMVEARDLGGACYGDSGGPNFVVIDGEMVLAATTITGEVPCYATNVAYRMDTQSARDFLEEFVALP